MTGEPLGPPIPPPDGEPDVPSEGGVPTPPDELANFFGVGDEGASGQLLSDLDEARKSGATRFNEIYGALGDAENPTVKTAREFGAMLERGFAGLSEDEAFRDIREILGDQIVDSLQRPEDVGGSSYDAVKRVLVNNLEGRTSGPSDIFRDLSAAEKTAERGAQRRIDQQRVLALKATLLGMSEQAFTDGYYESAVSDLADAKVDMVVHEPTWFVQSLAEAVDRADLQNPQTRQALLRLTRDNLLGVAPDMERRAKELPREELSGRELVLSKVHEAEEIDRRIKAEEEQARKKAEHEEKMREARDLRINAAISSGRGAFREHFGGGNGYTVEFRSNEGLALLAMLRGDGQLWSDIGNSELTGATGYVMSLQNVIETPQAMDKMIAVVSLRLYGDSAGKSQADYISEGGKDGWNQYVRGLILTEVYGNALGFLEGVIQCEEKDMADNTRAALLQKSLEVLGGGRALEGLFAGRGDLTDEQQLVRRAFADYVENPVQLDEEQRLAEDKKETVLRRKDRLRGLIKIVAQADRAVLDRRAEVETQARLKVEGEEKRRGELRDKPAQAKVDLEEIGEIREDALDLKAKGEKIQELGRQAAVPDFITVREIKTGKTAVLNIGIDEGRQQQASARMKDIKGRLAQAGEREHRVLRDELARAEAELEFISALAPLVARVNESQYKRVRKLSGFFRPKKLAVSERAFDDLPEPKPAEANELFEFPNVVRAVVNGITKPQENARTLEQLGQEVAKQVAAEDPLIIGENIDRTAGEISYRKGEGIARRNMLIDIIKRGIEYQALRFIKEKLKRDLDLDHRLAYKYNE